MPEVAPYNFQTAHDAVAGVRTEQGAFMDWARILAYVTGTVDQELLARNECLAAGPAQNVVRPWNWFAEPRADRSGIMPMTVWLRRQKLYAFSAFWSFEQGQPREIGQAPALVLAQNSIRPSARFIVEGHG